MKKAFLVIVCTVFALGCAPSIEDKEPRVRIAAIRKIVDQSILAEIAINDPDEFVRIAAAKKISENEYLEKVALLLNDRLINDKAVSDYRSLLVAIVNKIADNSTLVKVTLTSKNSEVAEAAANRITDKEHLTKIALETEYIGVIKHAISNLRNPSILASIAPYVNNRTNRYHVVDALVSIYDNKSISEDKPFGIVESVYLLVNAVQTAKNLPEKHHTRLIAELLPTIRILSDSDIKDKFGKIVSIVVLWEPKSSIYNSPSVNIPGGTVEGEWLKCELKLKNLPNAISSSWKTIFPDEVNTLLFRGADIKVADMLIPIFQGIQQPVLEKFLNDKEESIRNLAINSLPNDSISNKSYLQNRDKIIFDP